MTPLWFWEAPEAVCAAYERKLRSEMSLQEFVREINREYVLDALFGRNGWVHYHSTAVGTF